MLDGNSFRAFLACLILILPTTGKAQELAVANADSDLQTKTETFKQKFLAAKRVVFLGDSNTNAGEFINQIEATMLEQFDSVPEIINLGLPSETCCGLSEPIHPFPRPNVQERLARALEKTKPDFVFACYGMNDGIYHPFDESRFKAFQDGIKKLIAAHAATETPLVLLTPPPFDPQPMRTSGNLVGAESKEFSWKTIYENYDSEVIQKYAQWMQSLDSPDFLVIDTHQPINDYLLHRRATEPDLAFSNDGVHFDNAGHELFASIVLKGLGLDSKLSENKALLELVRKRQAISHPAWISEVGHLRPGVNPGLPLAEAQKHIEVVSKEIETLKQ